MDRTTLRISKAAESIRRHTDFVPQIVLTLGSGLGHFSRQITPVCEIPYSDIEGFVPSTVEGHTGSLIFGTLFGKNIALMNGRVHLYEGYTGEDVVLPLRTLRALGAEILLLTNACGGVNFSFAPGDLMLIVDHISSFVKSPLVGKNPDELGTRFPDMSKVYDPALCEVIRSAAAECSIDLKEGVYLQTSGPQFETPAEIRMYRTLGADAVGMSTAVEAIAARHCGYKIAGVSCVCNLACGMTDAPLTHDEVQEVGRQSAERFTQLIKTAIQHL